MNFKTYIHAVGTGVKTNRDLTLQESQDMMQQILEQTASREQIAAFLLGWRLKPETVDEFLGALLACDKYIKRVNIRNSIELGYPFDGKANNSYIFPLVSKILQNSGLDLVVMGDDIQPAKDGITIKDICTNIKLNPNLHYFDRADFCPPMHKLTDIRIKLGLRTGLNTIEKLSLVANSDYAITGVFHKPFLQRYTKIFANRYKRFALIQGNEGTPELFSKGRLWIAENEDNFKEFVIDPEYYGINYKKSWDKITLEESIAQINNPSDEYLKLAKLNAALYLFVAQKAKSVNEAFEILE